MHEPRFVTASEESLTTIFHLLAQRISYIRTAQITLMRIWNWAASWCRIPIGDGAIARQQLE